MDFANIHMNHGVVMGGQESQNGWSTFLEWLLITVEEQQHLNIPSKMTLHESIFQRLPDCFSSLIRQPFLIGSQRYLLSVCFTTI